MHIHNCTSRSLYLRIIIHCLMYSHVSYTVYSYIRPCSSPLPRLSFSSNFRTLLSTITSINK